MAGVATPGPIFLVVFFAANDEPMADEVTTFTESVQLSSGKFAIVEKFHEFTLVQWRPVIDRQLGKEVTGVVQGGSVSWPLGRQRDLGL